MAADLSMLSPAAQEQVDMHAAWDRHRSHLFRLVSIRIECCCSNSESDLYGGQEPHMRQWVLRTDG